MQNPKVAILASLSRPISPITAGGTEVFTSTLTSGLVSRGIDTTLFATSDSETTAKLASICNSSQTAGVLKGTVMGNITYELLQARNAILRGKEFDLFHNNYWAFHFFSNFSCFTDRPIITTIHNPFWNSPNLRETLATTHQKGKDVVVFLSESAKKLAGDCVDSVVINNGIDTDAFPFSATSDDHILWFSRLDPNKGIKPALDAAALGAFPLVVAGAFPLRQKNLDFIQSSVVPFFKDNIRYVGEPTKSERVSLYQNAKALLFPTLVDEQFGLVVVEAMSCGTPVIAYNRGAIPEVIVDGVTGFIIDPDDEPRPGKGSWIIKKQGIDGLIEAVNRVGEIKRADCRARVEKHFTVDIMVQKYIDLYQQVTSR